jgi:DNA-binding response OmpR family regulator
VRRLREKVEAEPSSPNRLVTVFGVGYRWDARPADAA